VAAPGWAQSFPAGQVFVASELNGKDVRGKGLTFLVEGAPGAASGFGGCNSWQVSYELKEPDRFTLGTIGTTKKLCPEGDIMQLEGEFVSALARVVRWRVAGLALILSGEGASVQLLRHGPR
jgi:heat shock protein HslJ